MLTRRTRPVLVTAVAAFAFFACWLLAGWGGPSTTAAVRDLGAPAFSGFAFTCAVATARSFRGRRRLAWAITAFGLFGWVLGDLIWAFCRIVLGTDPPFPSIADAAFLVMPIAVCISWNVNASHRSPLTGIRPLLDGLIVAGALFTISWVAVLRRVFADSELSTLQRLTTVAYPVTDIALLTMAVIVTSTLPASHRLSTGLFTAGLAVIALSDSALVYLSIHGVRTSGGLVIGWSVGMLLIAASALTIVSAPRPQVPRGRPSRTLFWLPYVPMSIAVLVGLGDVWSGRTDHPALIAGFLTVAVALIRHVTVLDDNRRLRETAAEQALRDPLTGLANRSLFADRLTLAMQSWERDRRHVAVMAMDLDDFKLVNDNLGHPQGDLLLRAVALRLQSVVPPAATLARLGGDEFAVLMEGRLGAEDVAQRVVEVFDKPFFLGGEEIYIHPSVGLASTSADPEVPVGDDDLFTRADLAMYAAKRAGIGGVQHFTSQMRHVDGPELGAPLNVSGGRRTPLADIALLGQLRRAIGEDALSLVYQPKVSLSTGAVVGVEALIRWAHPHLGPLLPSQFLPLVQRNGLMGEVTDLVVNRAVNDALTWYDPVHCAVPVAINLFATSLNDMSLPEGIAATLARSGLPATALSLEITEHLLLANVSEASTVIERLRAIGLAIAIDDFGSGYSTMSYLRDLHIDELKLDGQFIAPILRGERAAAIVRSVIDLAHTLGIVCVAEGVEDHATAARLRDYGCDIAQGHYFCRPVPADVLRETGQLGLSGASIFPVAD